MAPREAVLALEEEGAGQFEAHPHQPRIVDQHGAERGDRAVQQRHLFRVGKAGPPRRPDRREAVKKARFRPGRAAGRRQPGQRLPEPAVFDQRPYRGLVPCLARGAPGRRDEQDTDDTGENAADWIIHDLKT